MISGHVLTIQEGAQTIWLCAERKKPHVLFTIKAGLIDPNVWAKWENSLIQSFFVKSPYDVPYVIHLFNNKIIRNPLPTVKHPVVFPALDVKRYHVASVDGTMVPYVVIRQKGAMVKAQLVYVYGAYGATTPVDWPYQNWYPLLLRGWAIVFAYVRGGGDVDAAWAEAARREHRRVSIDDFESVIRSAQHKLKLGPEKTVIYGRSAGGLPVGAMVSRYPDGQLMGAAFTEVPYVDVLRTSSNPDLPLTIGEYKEFGNPTENLMHFKALLSVSPVNTVPSDGAPGVLVISHVGLLDKQVFAYESFKWIQRLRGAPPTTSARGKYVTFERKEAHQYEVEHIPRFRSMDLAILEAWVEQKLRY
jgi:prolyl oligopeptidase PreP (S9A serine peptidase family)